MLVLITLIVKVFFAQLGDRVPKQLHSRLCSLVVCLTVAARRYNFAQQTAAVVRYPDSEVFRLGLVVLTPERL